MSGLIPAFTSTRHRKRRRALLHSSSPETLIPSRKARTRRQSATPWLRVTSSAQRAAHQVRTRFSLIPGRYDLTSKSVSFVLFLTGSVYSQTVPE